MNFLLPKLVDLGREKNKNGVLWSQAHMKIEMLFGWSVLTDWNVLIDFSALTDRSDLTDWSVLTY